MKKRILIVSSSLNTGGLEHCLVNFCNSLDPDRYDVDLYLFNDGRTLLPNLSKRINLLPDSPYFSAVYNKPIAASLFHLLGKGKFALLCYRICRFIRIRLHRELGTVRDWHYMRKCMLKLSDVYDIAIGFEEGGSCWYVADCVKASVKLGWIHTDLKMVSVNSELDKSAFEKLDWICTVSANSLKSLKELYPQFSEKYRKFSLPAMLDYRKIDVLASEPCEMSSAGVRILSVGRLVELKGFHLCVAPLRRLLDEGFELVWYVAGEGEYREHIESLIRRYGVEEHFILLGNCSNPYKYIKNADICVQPSSYEGFSVAVWEEKYLQKPVIATDIPSNAEMISDGENGLLIRRSEDEIYQAVKKLLTDVPLRQKTGKTPAAGFQDSMNIMSDIEKLF